MNFEGNLYEKSLMHFARLYLLLGVIELRLRERIPFTLSNYGEEIGKGPWWVLLPDDGAQRIRILRAISRNDGELENFERFLTLRFWREIFSKKCFRKLWAPALHRVFTGLEDPLNPNSYSKVVLNLERAVQIRNRVAHFDATGSSGFKREERVLMWLVEALGGLSS